MGSVRNIFIPNYAPRSVNSALDGSTSSDVQLYKDIKSLPSAPYYNSYYLLKFMLKLIKNWGSVCPWRLALGLFAGWASFRKAQKERNPQKEAQSLGTAVN